MWLRGATVQAAPAAALAPERAIVIPMAIFAARRERFECVVRKNFGAWHNAIAVTFDALPLEENGWHRASTRIRHIGNTDDCFPIFRLERM